MNLPLQSRPVARRERQMGILPQSVACVHGTVENGAVCVNLPIIGKKCIDVGLHFANGLSASVCLERIFPPKVCAEVAGSRFCI
ncbi:hypothetical protein [Trinickia fusca]|nr:hypothetical protein [Trinickia fusca]